MAQNQLPSISALSRATPIKHGEGATWSVSSDTVALTSGTTGATTLSLGYLFHPATMAMKVDLLAARLSWAAGASTGDGIKVKLVRITAENGTPGGTAKTPAPADSRDSDPDGSTITAIFGATGAPTRGSVLATHMISHATPGVLDLVEMIKRIEGKAPIINAQTAEGLEVLIVTGTAGPATAAQFALTFDFIARRTA
jgi:hypothetical protein